MNTKVERLIVEITKLAQQNFSTRFLACYVIGSLARGGFSEHYSDVDVAIILADEITPADEQKFKHMPEQLIALRLPLAEKVSLFWQSANDLQKEINENPHSRLFGYDRMDLFQHGRLMWGVEVRPHQYNSPTQLTLEKEALDLVLEKLNLPPVLATIANPQQMFSQDLVPPSKLVLFPVRLIYTALAHKIGGNEDAANDYCQRYDDETVSLVRQALEWRQKLPDLSNINMEEIKENLPAIYRRFINIYREKMQAASETQLVQRLDQWEEALEEKIAERVTIG